MTPIQQLMLGVGSKGAYSNEFDGSSELTLPWSNANLDFGSNGNITIEFWVYLDTLNNNNYPYQTMVGRWHGSNGYCWLIDTNKNDGDINLYIGNANGNYVQSAHAPNGTLSASQWYHIAIVKGSNTSNASKIYVNGTSVLSFTWNHGNTNSSTGIQVGNNNSNYGSALDGKISNFRFTHGVVYSSNFTPPTAPFEGDDGGNVQLLMCKDADPTTAEVSKSAAGGSGANTITNNGGVTSSTDNPF